MTSVAKLKLMGQRGARENGHGFNHAPEHERRVSSWVLHKVLALEQSLEDKLRVWELRKGHGVRALNVAGVGVASFAEGREVDIVQRTISFTKFVARTDIRSSWMREVVVEEHDHLVLEPLAKAAVR